MGVGEEEYQKEQGDFRRRMEEKFLVDGAYRRNSRGETYGSDYFAR